MTDAPYAQSKNLSVEQLKELGRAAFDAGVSVNKIKNIHMINGYYEEERNSKGGLYPRNLNEKPFWFHSLDFRSSSVKLPDHFNLPMPKCIKDLSESISLPFLGASKDKQVVY